jgi:hypothetical protein
MRTVGVVVAFGAVVAFGVGLPACSSDDKAAASVTTTATVSSAEVTPGGFDAPIFETASAFFEQVNIVTEVQVRSVGEPQRLQLKGESQYDRFIAVWVEVDVLRVLKGDLRDRQILRFFEVVGSEDSKRSASTLLPGSRLLLAVTDALELQTGDPDAFAAGVIASVDDKGVLVEYQGLFGERPAVLDELNGLSLDEVVAKGVVK